MGDALASARIPSNVLRTMNSSHEQFFARALTVCAVVIGVACVSIASVAHAQAVAPADPGRAPANIRQLELIGPTGRGASIPFDSFVAEVESNEIGGECNSASPFGPNSTVVIANFPTRAAPLMNAVLTFDSVGHLIRYNETRGFSGARGVPATATPAERDSIRAAQGAAIRSTSISFDYTTGLAILRNFGGRQPSVIATAPVAVVEKMPQFGPINERVERVRKLCGV
jgi:hypothetical protein